ncbi:hypothetical protein C2869_21525 [Saccharobesus litoralis]|uniref:MSHA biogenesis protein MshJ n=1 Tax=Saccharobesus litoralis TaxID=2172099 RepID=A0A2S0VXH8_9ALTE|nr:type II secretion system protein GspM [Saccharobesus litoralis]AWB68820.1 hypothetical protein C2869_21525 [Saccharobesus litoralis]
MTEQWQQIQGKYQQLSTREKVMTLASGVVLVLFVGFFNIIEPIWLKSDKIAQTVKSNERELNSLLAVNAQFESHLQTDPNISLAQKIEQLNNQLQAVNTELTTSTGRLLKAKNMARVVRDMLSQMNGIQVVKFETLEPTAMLSPDAGLKDLNLYKHGVALSLRGSYRDLYTFLAKTEVLEWQFRWEDFQLVVKEHPNLELTIKVYAMSLEQGFIGL